MTLDSFLKRRIENLPWSIVAIAGGLSGPLGLSIGLLITFLAEVDHFIHNFSELVNLAVTAER